MGNPKTQLKKVELTIDTSEYICKVKNKTRLSFRKEFIEAALAGSTVENTLVYISDKIFEDDNFFKRQKVIALINLVKDLKSYVNEQEQYSLNLVIRNLKSYYKVEKEDKHFILKDERMMIVHSLIKIAFSSSFNHILKNMYKIEKKDNK